MGERFSEEELNACLQALTGTSTFDGQQRVGADNFLSEILGFTDEENNEPQ
eukprot:CAMPEP_0185774454 /NCGR_PEP_ID=MMETSP1174-20130828/78243_1 /TAXON_ID=35687 /ORGANISM="Dictyocha speculum, Strain CCMP1381" /LENGTH=50 /DNA_ID=CAMNT_0028461621 /DNA_START=58 /DNA_END=210 /DNA_ORIENTATION=-